MSNFLAERAFLTKLKWVVPVESQFPGLFKNALELCPDLKMRHEVAASLGYHTLLLTPITFIISSRRKKPCYVFRFCFCDGELISYFQPV